MLIVAIMIMLTIVSVLDARLLIGGAPDVVGRLDGLGGINSRLRARKVGHIDEVDRVGVINLGIATIIVHDKVIIV